jgi:hypothetical protein
MNVTVAFDPARRWLVVRAQGPITLGDIRKHLEDERASGELGYAELIDARGYTPAFSSADVREIVETLRELAKAGQLGPTAIVVDTAFGFGMLRMLEMLVEDVCLIRPFYRLEDAENWLAEFSSPIS